MGSKMLLRLVSFLGRRLDAKPDGYEKVSGRGLGQADHDFCNHILARCTCMGAMASEVVECTFELHLLVVELCLMNHNVSRLHRGPALPVKANVKVGSQRMS